MAKSESPLRGPEKVAAFLLSLERAAASDVLKHLPEDVLPDVVDAMESLGASGRNEDLMRELYAKVALADAREAPSPKRPRGSELEQLLSASLGPERAASVLELIQARRGMERPFRRLESSSPTAIVGLLSGESPQIVALILAHLEPELSAQVLDMLEVEFALDVVSRMAGLEPPSFEVLGLLASELEPRLAEMEKLPQRRTPTQRLQTIAEMLTNATGDIGPKVLDGLEERAAGSAKEIREMLFTWEDIGDLDRWAMQKILGTVETRTLSIALKACSAGVEENVMNNLSTRVRDMVAEERDLAGALPMSDVRAARETIMVGVRALIEAGEFSPSKGGDELVS